MAPSFEQGSSQEGGGTSPITMRANTDRTADEIRSLNGCINDLTTILALPAIWIGNKSSHIISTLLEALVGIMSLDFAFARLGRSDNQSSSQTVRFGLGQRQSATLQAKDIGRALHQWTTDDVPPLSLPVPNPIGEGSTRIAVFRLGVHDDPGILVAGSVRPDFPTKIEVLLLRVAVSQGAIGLQESRLLDEQKQAAAADRKQAQEALRASEERFRRYFELGLVGMAMTSPTKGILEVNDELCRILGYSRSELLKLTWEQMTHPGDLAADIAQFNRVLAGEIDGYTLDKRWIRKDGRVTSSIMSVRGVRNADGTLDYLVGLVQDITERKVAEEEQRKLAALVENSPEFIGITSLEGQLYVINAAGRELVGLGSPAQVLETKVLDYIVEEDREAFQRALASALLEGHWEGETRFRHFKTGAEIPIRQRIFLIKEPGTNRPVAMATIASDITARKRSEEALRAAQAELAHMSRVTMMGETAASVAHEMNQPLTAVVTNGDAGLRWLSQNPPNVAEARLAMKEMVRQGHRASEVIARIRAQIKKGPPRIELVHVNQLLEDVRMLTRQQAAEHGVTLQTELASDIDTISGDSVQLQQVLVNLIMNAIEATSAKNNGLREVVLSSTRQGTGEVVVAVRDSGTGIDPRHADQLFRPFFTTKATGLGMGLAISRSIIESHGGRLWATTNERHGATFQFSLPALSMAEND